MRRKKNSGSAMAWVVMLLFVSTILIATILPLAMANIENSRQQNQDQQAYLTAKSVADMVVEYLSNNVEEGPGKSIQDKAISAGDEGITWNVTGLDESMGSCQVNVTYQNYLLYVTATATCSGESKSVCAIMEKEVTVGELEAVENIQRASGYEGISVSNASASSENTGFYTVSAISENQQPVWYEVPGTYSVIPAKGNGADTDFLVSAGGIVVTNPIKGATVYPIISSENISIQNSENEFAIMPRRNIPSGIIADSSIQIPALYCVGDIELEGNITFEQPVLTDASTQPVISGNNVSIKAGKAGAAAAQGYAICSNTDVSLEGIVFLNTTAQDSSLIPACIKANQKVVLRFSEYTDSVIEGTILCNDFVIEDSSTSGKKINVGSIECQSAAISSGSNTVNIEELIVKGNVSIQGNVTIQRLISGGNVTIDGGSVYELTCNGTVSLQNGGNAGTVVCRSFSQNGENGGVSKTVSCYQSFAYTGNGHGANSGNVNSGSGVYQRGTNDKGKVTYIKTAEYTGTDTSITVTAPSVIRPVVSIVSHNNTVSIPVQAAFSGAKELLANTIDNRTSNTQIHVYKISSNQNWEEFTLDSHGDTYIYLDGVNVNIGKIKGQVYYGNLIFILRNNAKLTLGDGTVGNNIAAFVYNEPGNSGGTLALNSNLSFQGQIVSAALQTGENVTFSMNRYDGATGSFDKKYARWRLIQYK